MLEEFQKDIIKLYTVDNFTLRKIAKIYNTNHHSIRRLLVKNGVTITQKNRKREPFTAEHKSKISASRIGMPGVWLGKKMPESALRKNMINHMKFDVSLEDIEEYTDFKKLQFITSGLSRNMKHFHTKEQYINYINKFYYDEQFNVLYQKWLLNGKDKWYRPTIDHKTSKSQGGGWELTNLQFLSWFENRAKAEMNHDEWEEFKYQTNTRSDLFV